jgi:hypothetical protein
MRKVELENILQNAKLSPFHKLVPGTQLGVIKTLFPFLFANWEVIPAKVLKKKVLFNSVTNNLMAIKDIRTRPELIKRVCAFIQLLEINLDR